MDSETVRNKTCQCCRDCNAEVLVTERSTDAYGQQTLEIIKYACTDCTENLIDEGYRETPIADVDPEVVEVEVRRSEDDEFVIKKRDSNGKWLKTPSENIIDDLEARR